MDVCVACKAIPFDTLPSEDEPAIPHHKTLQALAQSATKCYLCSLIIGAAGEICKMLQNIKEGKEDENPGGWNSAMAGEMLPSGNRIMYFSTEGNWSVGGMMAGSGYKGPIYLDPCKMFPGESKVRPWVFGNWWRLEDSSELKLVGLGVRLGETGILNEAAGNTEESIHFWGTNLRIRTDNNAPMSSLIPGRIRSLHSESIIGLKRAKMWIDKCDQSHSCAPQIQILPTRVLVIDESPSASKIHLLNTAGLKGRYVALSHCWGLSHRITTTKATLESHGKGMLISELPKTFRDAVLVTRLMGLKYLWIDSLCIIQDDARDWEKEAALMGEVYANSYLTIAASSSTDDSSGCFISSNDRCAVAHVCSDNRSLGRPVLGNASPLMYLRPNNPQPAYMSQQSIAYINYIPLSKPGAMKSTLYISEEWMPTSLKSEPKTYQIGKFGGSFDPLDTEPLAKRAWTLQERLLAPRTLHYAKEQMYWECLEGILPEDGALFPRIFPSMRTLLGLGKPDQDIAADLNELKLDNSTTPKSKNFATDANGFSPWGDAWLKLVEKYTRRALTREEDKFPALSGLARSIASYTKDTYYAGIWSNYLLNGLFWQVHAYEPHHFCDNPEHDHQIAKITPATKSKVRIPERYRAPSWSWASLDAEIEFQSLNNTRIAECVECVTLPSGIDVYGRLKEGAYIMIQAPMLELKEEASRHIPGTANPTPFTTTVSATFKTKHTTCISKGSAHFDQEAEFPCSAVFLDLVHALIVKRVGTAGGVGDEAWQRIGIVSFSESDMPVAAFEMTREERVAWRFGEDVDGIVIIK